MNDTRTVYKLLNEWEVLDESWKAFWKMYYAKKVPHPKTGKYYKGPARPYEPKDIQKDTGEKEHALPEKKPPPEKEASTTPKEEEYDEYNPSNQPTFPPRKKAAKLISQPTPEQKEATWLWASSKYGLMRALDYGESTGVSQKDKRYNRALDEFLARNSGHGKPVTLIRGAAHSADFLKHIEVGHEFSFGAKTSFTTDRSAAQGYTDFSGKGGNEYPTFFHAKTSSGVDLSSISDEYGGERLMPKNTEFTVARIIKKPYKENGKRLIRYDVWLEDKKPSVDKKLDADIQKFKQLMDQEKIND